MQNQQIIGVKEFVSILNETLEFAFPSVTIEGEVSGFKINQNKFVFFDLKDDDTTLGCFMMRQNLKVMIEDGMRIRVSGAPKITKWGRFSFTVRQLELAGEGELKRAYELLKVRLSAEGLFEQGRKRALPQYPQRIGLITSATSAAYADFIKIIGQRWGGLTIQLADVTVQGQSAEKQIVAALENFNQLSPLPDVVVLIRGGGSLEDLQAFNTESVARSVAASRVPIVVGVGHEVDISLADLAADLRAATPTDAARLVVADKHALISQVSAHKRQLVARQQQQVSVIHSRIAHSFELQIQFLARPRERLAYVSSSLDLGIAQTCQRLSREVTSLSRVLGGFDPRAILQRGYGIVRSETGNIIYNAQSAPAGSKLVIQLAETSIHAKVDNGTDS